MPKENFLNAISDPITEPLRVVGQSLYLPQDSVGTDFHTVEHVAISPSPTGDVGGVSRFKIANAGTYIRGLTLQIVVSAVSTDGTAATTALTDYGAFAMLERVVLKSGTSVIIDESGDDFYHRYRMTARKEEIDAKSQSLLGGDLTLAERRASDGTSSAAQTFYVEIPGPWTGDLSNALPIAASHRELELVVTYRAMAGIIEGGNGDTITFSITDQNLICEYVHVPVHERDLLLNAVVPTSQGDGIEYHYVELQKQENVNISSGATQGKVDLDNLTLPSQLLLLSLRAQSDLDTSQDVDRYNSVAVTNYYLEERGQNIDSWAIPHIWGLSKIWVEQFPDVPSPLQFENNGVTGADPLYPLSFGGFDVFNPKFATGWMAFQHLTNPKFVFNCSALGSAHYATVYSVTRNILLVRGTDIRRVAQN
jgi:hypothetical protein